MKVGFIGLGNVGGKLAGSLIRNGIDTVVRDLDRDAAQKFIDRGAGWADSPKQMAEMCDVIITCLPSPAACSDGHGRQGRYPGWPDARQDLDGNVDDRRRGSQTSGRDGARPRGGRAVDCPVSGGCHRAAIRATSRSLPVATAKLSRRFCRLTTVLGRRRVLHTGPIGICLDAQGHDQLPGHRKPAHLLRGAGNHEGSRHGPGNHL